MVIAFVAAMQRAGLDPAKHLHVTGVDIDRKVLYMAYVQLSRLGVPALSEPCKPIDFQKTRIGSP